MKLVDESINQQDKHLSNRPRIPTRPRRHYQKKSLLPKLPNRKKLIHKVRFTSTLASEQTRQTSALSANEEKEDLVQKELEREDECLEDDGATKGAVQDILQGIFKDATSGKFEFENCEPNLWSYLPSIGEHLSRHQTDCLPPLIVYGAHLTLFERLRAVDTLIKMSARLNFKLETLFFAVNIFNRIVSAPRFLLISNGLKCIGSLFVAAKYEEVAIPKIETFTYLDVNARCSREHILRMEQNILLELEFNMNYISPLKFVDLICAGYKINLTTRELLYRLTQQCLGVQELLNARSSVIALGCISFLIPQLPLLQQLSGNIKEEYDHCREVIGKSRMFGRIVL